MKENSTLNDFKLFLKTLGRKSLKIYTRGQIGHCEGLSQWSHKPNNSGYLIFSGLRNIILQIKSNINILKKFRDYSDITILIPLFIKIN